MIIIQPTLLYEVIGSKIHGPADSINFRGNFTPGNSICPTQKWQIQSFLNYFLVVWILFGFFFISVSITFERIY